MEKEKKKKNYSKCDHSEMGMVNIFVCFFFSESVYVYACVYILLYNFPTTYYKHFNATKHVLISK